MSALRREELTSELDRGSEVGLLLARGKQCRLPASYSRQGNGLKRRGELRITLRSTKGNAETACRSCCKDLSTRLAAALEPFWSLQVSELEQKAWEKLVFLRFRAGLPSQDRAWSTYGMPSVR